ncbi:hypothetical protein [Fluviispira multicolorata]|uniref:Gliding-motility protein MglA n=1 Tax=Fluviispira multicolorata TaxID=2654512 RepID=A0A833JBF6_9BACT|nr:hypothetical protein [Fluviispira multicolorata]KAB8029172.1 hypothetical protein GCL57_11590 [Fluviispira multicolorata]
MAFINEATGDIHFKILYIGSQSAGKTANIQSLFCETHSDLSEKESTFLLENVPRNTFFDFLPLSFDEVGGRNSRMHIYTLPAHSLWPSVNINLMLGVDGIVNVIDSRVRFLDKNEYQIQYIKKLMDSLQLDFHSIPFVYQFNHSDSPDALPFATLKKNFLLNEEDCIEAIANTGVGVMKTFKKITDKIIRKFV